MIKAVERENGTFAFSLNKHQTILIKEFLGLKVSGKIGTATKNFLLPRALAWKRQKELSEHANLPEGSGQVG